MEPARHVSSRALYVGPWTARERDALEAALEALEGRLPAELRRRTLGPPWLLVRTQVRAHTFFSATRLHLPRTFQGSTARELAGLLGAYEQPATPAAPVALPAAARIPAVGVRSRQALGQA